MALTASTKFAAAQLADVNQPVGRVYLVLGDYANADAYGATASSSGAAADYPAAGAIDGDRTELNIGPAAGADNRVGQSSWKSSTIPDTTSTWLKVTFDTARTINRIKLYHRSGHGSKYFMLEYWDGASWVPFVTVGSGGGGGYGVDPYGSSAYGGGGGGGVGTDTTTMGLDVFNFTEFTTTEIRMTVTGTEVALEPAEVVALEAYRVLDISERVTGQSVERSRDYKLSNVLASTATVTLDNRDRFFSPLYVPTMAEVAAGFVNSELRPGLGIIVKYGFSFGSQEELVTVFSGSVDSLRVNSAARQVDISARDGMKSLIDQQVSSNLQDGLDIGAAALYALNTANISSYEAVCDTTSIILDHFFVEGSQLMTTLQELAQACGDASFYFDEEGIARFVVYINSIPQQHITTSQADWEAGTQLVGIDTATTPGAISFVPYYNYTPGSHSFVVPSDVTRIYIDMAGAGPGGRGARVCGHLTVTPGDTIYANVGSGSTGVDIRIGGTALSDRVMVAGDGGWNSGSNQLLPSPALGGDGGLNGYPGQSYTGDVYCSGGGGGTQSYGGAFGTGSAGFAATDGSLGLGGAAAGPGDNAQTGGAGGGGYYGGGGGGCSDDGPLDGGSGGGGGSSLVPVGAVCTDGYNAGDGYIKVFMTGYESAVFDQGATLLSEGVFSANYATPGGSSLSFYTATSIDGSTFDPWVAATPDSAISSVVNRFIKFKIEQTAGFDFSPFVYDVTLNWNTGVGRVKYPDAVTFFARFDTTAIGIEQEVTDNLGGDTSILNDVEVVSSPLILSGTDVDTAWQGTANVPAVDISITNPLVVSVGTYEYECVVNGGVDITNMSGASPAAAVVTFGGGAAGSWVFSKIHPTRPTLTITVTAPGTIEDLRVVGKKFSATQTPFTSSASDAQSIALYRKRSLSITNNYIVNGPIAALIAARLIRNYKAPVTYVPSLELQPTWTIQLNDRVNIVDDNTGIVGDFYVVGINHSLTSSESGATAATRVVLIHIA